MIAESNSSSSDEEGENTYCSHVEWLGAILHKATAMVKYTESTHACIALEK